MKHVYKTIKRIFLFTLALFFLLALFPLSVFASEAVANGTFGDALVWTLDAEGTLTISGAGAMPDYTYTSHAPWYNSRNTIKGVIIDNGVENIGNFAFIGCSRLESVIIGDHVTCIGDRAFDDCISLDSISIPENVVKIGVMAFVNCKSLSIIYFEGNAPEFEVTKLDGSGIYASFCFQDVTATVYYPAGNITWTDEIMQNYSGNITWHPYEMETGSTSELSNGVTLYIPVVESRLDKYKHDDLTVEDQQKCRGLLYDLNGDNTVELILRLKDEYSFYYEVWSITNEKAVCVNEPFFWGFEPRVLLSHFEGRKALVYQDWSAGSGAASEITTVYTFEEIPYKESYTLHHENIFDIDTPDEIGDYYYINGSKVSENEYKEQLSIVTDGIELFAAETQYEGLNLSELLNYLKDNPTSGNTESDTTINLVTDHTNLCVRKDNEIVFGAELIVDGMQVEDVSGITFQIEDASILETSASFMKDNCLYASFTGIKEGTTTILFNDSNSGAIASIPVTVYSNNYLSFTLSSVPTQQIDKYETNFYNVNGLYIDSYTYSVNDDQSATVSFAVYNSNYTYGAVEIYDVNGNLTNAVLIDKMSSSMTSMKEVLWDDVVYLVRDIIDGDLLSYRQESGFSKKTDISVTIPKNGYIKICNDPENSTIVNLVNSADLLMSLASFMGEVKGYDTNSTEFAEKLTQKLVTEKVFAEFVKDGNELPKKLWSNVGKGIISSPETLSSFSETIVHNIMNLELEDVILSTAMDFGIGVGEETFTYFAGPFGVALKSIFAIGTMEDILVQHAHITQSAGIGSIFIQNQGGGILGAQQVTVESKIGFDPETALRVFSVSIDPELLSEIKTTNYELYEAISNNTSYTYDISLLKNGNETQPGSKVTVCIPIPQAWRVPMPDEIRESIYAGVFKIYRIEEDGSATEMQIDVRDGCFVFETDHFSLYTLVKYDIESDGVSENTKNTSDGLVWIAVMIGGIIVIFVAILLFYKQRKRKNNQA